MGSLKSFAYHYVTLEESPWKQQREDLIETYLALDNDELLHYFRVLAGIPDKGRGLAGWYGDGASTFGQKLGAFARLYLETGDVRLYDKAVALADGWGECARASRDVIDINDTYVYDKLMGGFLDLYEYLHYEPAKDYIKWLTESADCRFVRTVRRDGLQVAPIGEDPEHHSRLVIHPESGEGNQSMIEWYTLPEQLYRAYLLTKEPLYLRFAKEWDYPYYYEKLAAKDFAIGPRHAYSHVNTLSSAMMAYRVTGEKKYLEAACNAYEEILVHHTFATGGYGPAECLFPAEEGYLGDSVKANWDTDKRHKEYRNFGDSVVTRDDQWGSCEVSCCAWAVFKLCNYLLQETGNAKYGDWAERLLYNGTGGQLPVTSEGKVMYYADYFMNGGCKTTEDGRLHPNGASFEWQCCTGTFPQDVAEYPNMLYYYDISGLYVSQYLPSTVQFTVEGNAFCLKNTSRYPMEQRLRFVLHGRSEQLFAIRFRVPSWASGQNVVCVNGEPQAVQAEPDTWMELKRRWKDGDEITIDFEFTLRLVPVDSYAPDVAALCYGPLVLVCDKMSVFEGDMQHPSEWLEPVEKEGYSYAFRTRPGHVKPFGWLTRDFYPYCEVLEMEWYYMYNRYCGAPASLQES